MSTVPANASAALSTTLVDELVRGGVRHVVLAPGSRSAALAFALHDAASAGRLALHTRIDERSAAFLALGLATTSRSPVAVVTTSGTAVANLHPAVLEASHRGLPLLVLSADRPASLRGTQANQTTDQVRIFGTATRLDVDVPPGDPRQDQPAQVASWRALACRALAAARGEGLDPAGPVQLNLQLVEPLVPDVPDGWSAPVDGRADGARWTSPQRRAAAQPSTLETGPRTVVVAGDDAGPPARILAERNGWPLLAEPTSGSRTGDNAIRTYRLLLGRPGPGRPHRARGGLRAPDAVATGDPADLEPRRRGGRGAQRDRLHRPGPPGVPGAGVAGGGLDRLEPTRGTTGGWRSGSERDAEVSRALDAFLAGRDGLTPHQVAGAVAAALPPRGCCSSVPRNPVRDLDLMVPRYNVGDRRLVIGNRGLAGIDGCVSTAVGAALGRPRTTRAFALLGDVTFLHDTNGLLLGPEEQRPDLTVVVVNDDGGSIFASLEQGDTAYAASYEKLFGTPHHVDLASLCAATRTPHWKVDSLPELQQALASPNGGIEVVEAVVTRHDRRELDAAIRFLGAQD